MKCEICELKYTNNDNKYCDDCLFYKKYRDKWNPKKIGKDVKILFFAESPPRVRKNNVRPYFYDMESQNEGGLWKQFNTALKIHTNEKKEFLSEFQKRGYLLEDLFPTHQYYLKFKENQYNKNIPNRKHVLNRFITIINEAQPENIVFICKRAMKLITLPFPTRFNKKNKNKFKEEIQRIIES